MLLLSKFKLIKKLISFLFFLGQYKTDNTTTTNNN